ncbi:carbon-nitrogen hydrolase family protein [Streptomyces odontomachi]|uniref:carbon-nitrogen hydrolase family protein n=1 Tax=Streptomyces odontomachi TaxID=2944940 RepID=UPI00210D5D21|nr:carbon-nitrogen hydrolase family protein [Streptomyces sp. ODS25]
MSSVTVAAVQLELALGEVSVNLSRAEQAVKEVCRAAEPQFVVVPEFFTSGMALSRGVPETVSRGTRRAAVELLQTMAVEHNTYVAGSLLIEDGGDVVNRMYLAGPDRDLQWHDKDVPTMWENFYFTGRGDPGVAATRHGPVGLAMCWEFCRTATAHRLADKVNLVLGASCYWSAPSLRQGAPDGPTARQARERRVAVVRRFAGLLRRPVVNATAAGRLSAPVPGTLGALRYHARFEPATQILDGTGTPLALGDEDGPCSVVASVDIGGAGTAAALPDDPWLRERDLGQRVFWWFGSTLGPVHYRLAARRRVRRADRGDD